ncbi:hypothetical protein CCP3SC15_2410004 [Gammaproteobacteria bacterium]
MAIWAVALAVFSAIKEVLSIQIINKAIDNLVAGTPTKIDDALWRAIEDVTGCDPDAARVIVESDKGAERVLTAAARVQSWYEAMSPEAWVSAKEAVA